MSEITIKLVSVNDVQTADNIDLLLDEYAQESALDGMPSPVPDWRVYRIAEEAGCLFSFGAYADDKLVGFIGVQMTYAAQYSAHIGSTMAFFVDSNYRKFGTGKYLVDHASDELSKRGAAAIAIGAPSESRLAKAAQSLGFKETNRLYMRTLP